MAIGVFVDVFIKEGELGAFMEHMSEMVELTKLEDGCIAYDIYEETDGSGGVVFMEIWESQEALDKHMESEHFLRLIPSGDVFFTKPKEVRIFSKL